MKLWVIYIIFVVTGTGSQLSRVQTIDGGIPVEVDEFPFMVQIRTEWRESNGTVTPSLCGGSIVSPSVGVTWWRHSESLRLGHEDSVPSVQWKTTGTLASTNNALGGIQIRTMRMGVPLRLKILIVAGQIGFKLNLNHTDTSRHSTPELRLVKSIAKHKKYVGFLRRGGIGVAAPTAIQQARLLHWNSWPRPPTSTGCNV